ncbi:MAG: TIGR02253 family HAD-type hydrolase [Nanoarchaeota archaeon]
MIKAILFDLDNTLIDFMRLKKQSCEAAIDAMIDSGLNVNKKKAIKQLFEIYDKYGLEDPKVFQRYLKKVIGKIDYRILAHGIVAYRRIKVGFLEPYPHTQYVLLKLKSKGLKLGIVTDAPRLNAWLRLASMKIADFFDVIVTFEDTKQCKPSKLPFQTAVDRLKIKASECLMVGDMPNRDMKGAKRIGMKTCFASYGNPKIKVYNTNFIIKDIKDLLNII